MGLLPSDTIYGLSGRAMDETAVGRIRRIKGRANDKPFIVLVSSIKMLGLLSIPLEQAGPVKEYWPGPLSAVFKAPGAPDWLRAADGTLAVRLPDYPELRSLIDRTGPLISTSANLSGGQPAATVQESKERFGDKLDFYVDIGPLNNPPSTVVSVKGKRLEVLRPGTIKINT